MAKSKWDERSEANLLPLSVSDDFEIALKEWRYSNKVRVTDEMNCELCGKKDLHYQFQILNTETKNTLWVGSSCINKFDIYVEDEQGREIKTSKDTYLVKHFKHLQVVEALDKLLDTQPTGDIKGHSKISLDQTVARAYVDRQKLDPKQINYLFMRLEEEGIPFEKKHFTITDTNENAEKLLTLDRTQFNRIKSILPKALIDYFNRCKR